MKRARTLYQLQKTETEMAQKGRRLKEVEASIKESEDLIQARAAIDKGQKRIKDGAARLRRIELESQGLQTETAAEEKRLYGGRITSPKELASLEEKIKNLRHRRAKLEDDQLGAMLELEDAEKDLAISQERLALIEAEWTASQGTLIEERDRLRKELARSANERVALRQVVASADLTFYENLSRRKGGVGVARIVDGACRGCGVAVPPRQSAAVYDTDDLIVCSHCERILYGER